MRSGFSFIYGLMTWGCLAFCAPIAFAATNAIEGKEHKIRLEAPDFFQPDSDLNETADIALSNRDEGAYCIVLKERIKDFPKDYTLEEYSATTLSQLSARLDKASQTKTDLSELQGYPATQYVLRGVFKNGEFDVVYLITCVKGPQYLIQAYCWSQPSKWDEFQPVYEKMMKSLQGM